MYTLNHPVTYRVTNTETKEIKDIPSMGELQKYLGLSKEALYAGNLGKYEVRVVHQ